MNKAPDAFRTISEVAEDLDIPQHVLRFWETRFSSIKPLKRGGGRRYYRPDDVELLKGIRQLLYGQGYTIKGVQRILKEEGARVVQEIGRGGALSVPRAESAPVEYDEPDFGQYPASAPEPPRPVTVEPPSSYVAVAPPSQATSGFVGNDLDRLRAALAELHECQRIIDALKRQ